MRLSRRSSRRTLLGGAVAFAGLAGSGLAKLPLYGDGSDEQSSSALREPGQSLPFATLFIDRFTLQTPGGKVQRNRGDQSLLRGTLLGEDGAKTGELFASAVTMPGPIDSDSPGTARMETQILRLHDGTITAIGMVFAQSDIPNIYTIMGGTGRYTGARGTYSFENNPNVARPGGRAAIHFGLAV